MVAASGLPPLGVLEKPLEKKSGRNYGPPGTKKLIYFIDDMNMPEVDKYGTVAPHTLIRQHMDHGHWQVGRRVQTARAGSRPRTVHGGLPLRPSTRPWAGSSGGGRPRRAGTDRSPSH